MARAQNKRPWRIGEAARSFLGDRLKNRRIGANAPLRTLSGFPASWCATEPLQRSSKGASKGVSRFSGRKVDIVNRFTFKSEGFHKKIDCHGS
jgi:hypothetical protein